MPKQRGARPLAACGFEAGARIVLMRRLGMAAMRMSGAARRSHVAGPAAPTRPLVVLAIDGAPTAD
ncbi:hypothetical protein IHQ68_09400 [Chelatococcus sambhunathii]|uniref:Uncharacterized protein n=1 Tax=Chelatococcus sambhunathii TaxID=363953 RepID=A0ABU1DFG0_9HYPH|nr:hypothetical protein [Chelatococcus sambhunathii]MDR4306832.1 hypothetical protein [Chelatococcus sambhunathii]